MKAHMSIEDEQARFLRCIGEPTRLQILKLLADSEQAERRVRKEEEAARKEAEQPALFEF